MRSDTAITRAPRDDARRRGVALDRFACGSVDAAGIRLSTLGACDSLQFHTRNSIYTVWIVDPDKGRAIVQGGTHFTQSVEATIAGATAGGSLIKLGWILQGFNVEIVRDGQRIVTTPVRAIHVNDTGILAGPF